LVELERKLKKLYNTINILLYYSNITIVIKAINIELNQRRINQ